MTSLLARAKEATERLASSRPRPEAIYNDVCRNILSAILGILYLVFLVVIVSADVVSTAIASAYATVKAWELEKNEVSE
jgi:hypothetical protein